MALINGKLEGRMAGHKTVLQDTQRNFPFYGRTTITGPFFCVATVPSILYEVGLTDSLLSFSDLISIYKYIGYIFLKDAVKFEIKGNS